MDWPKIKTYLIVLLIATNLLLAFVIIQDLLLFKPLHESNMEDMLSYLKSQQISVELDDLTFPRQIQAVYLDFLPLTEDKIGAYLGENYDMDEEGFFYNTSHVVAHSDHVIIWAEFAHLNRIIHDSESNLLTFEPVEDIELREKFESQTLEFLKNEPHDIEYYISKVLELGSYNVVFLRQAYQGITVEESKALVWFYDDEIVGFKQSWPANISANAYASYDILSIERALFLTFHQFKPNDSIIDVSIVYKLNDQSLLVSDLISGEALPFFRFQMQSGAIYYVQAVDQI